MTDRNKKEAQSANTAAEGVEPAKEKGNTKDRAAKALLSLNDVFCSAINVLCCGGKEVMTEDELTEAQPLSRYKMAQQLREQYRDVAKFWEKAGMRLLLVGIEHQSTSLEHMVVRAFSYDAAEYMRQVILKLKKKKKEQSEEKLRLHPVITIVLHFGLERWSGPRTLKELLKDSLDEVPDELKPFVQNYRLNIIEFAFLTKKQREMLHPDLRMVAEFLRCQRLHRDYTTLPDLDTPHPEETIELVYAILGRSKDAEAAVYSFFDSNQEDLGLKHLFIQLIDQGRAEGEAKGRAEGEAQGIVKGKKEGADMLHRLYEAMMKAGKSFNSVVKETNTERKRNKLYQQYGITPA
ncbi:MAG: Rpn family recombination-promoting nuclease/putative transposase [Succinivibrio sp.]|nr:Rpn family recombination-promoting nuclease/putative transposase [Succinivibrio sp.]